MSPATAIIVFDGHCRLCHRSLRFVEARESAGAIRYAPFDSQAGRQLCERLGIDVHAPDSFVLVDTAGVHLKARAWARVLRTLRAPWPVLGWLLDALPDALSAWGYDFVGRHRYRWFGRFETCPWPAPDDARAASSDDVEAMLGAHSV